MEKKEQIEKMNLEVKENLKLTDEEYEKTKDVLSRLNEIELEANPELIEKIENTIQNYFWSGAGRIEVKKYLT